MDQIDGGHAKAVLSDEYLNKVDRLVAEKVMEWQVKEAPGLFSGRFQAWCRQSKSGQWWPIVPVEDWKPTRNRDQAMMVFERCEDMVLAHNHKGGFVAIEDILVSPANDGTLPTVDGYKAETDTPMLAVCLGALEKHGVEVPA